jgi:hypothetical protein
VVPFLILVVTLHDASLRFYAYPHVACLDVRRHRHNDIVLVIFFDSAFHGWINMAKMLKKAYAPIFGTVAFTGFGVLEDFPKDEIWVGCDPDWHAEHMYTCFGNAVQELAAPPSGGYLFIYYNSLIAHCQIPIFDKGKIWFDHDLTPRVCSSSSFLVGATFDDKL